MNDRDALDAVRHASLWLNPSQDGLAPLLDLIGDAHASTLEEVERLALDSLSRHMGR